MNVGTDRKFRKQWGTGHMGKNLNMGRGSWIDGPRERTSEQRHGVEQRRSPNTDTGHWVKGDLEVQFSQKRGRRLCGKSETIAGGEPERERHRKKT